MIETSIITGKVTTSSQGPGSTTPKKLYIKIFPGLFTYKPPRPKKAKIYSGELLIKYSSREWPEKKNGPLLGDPGLLEGVSQLLSELNLINVNDLAYSATQYQIKEMITIKLGSKLAEELVTRGWVLLDQPVIM